MRKLMCKIGLHTYDKVDSNGMTAYYECKVCDKRKYRQKRGGHQPVDKEWLEGADREPMKTSYRPPGSKSVVCPTSDEDPRGGDN